MEMNVFGYSYGKVEFLCVVQVLGGVNFVHRGGRDSSRYNASPKALSSTLAAYTSFQKFVPLDFVLLDTKPQKSVQFAKPLRYFSSMSSMMLN
jgi:hypothetical protein